MGFMDYWYDEIAWPGNVTWVQTNEFPELMDNFLLSPSQKKE